MSLSSNISDFATRVGTEFKAVRSTIGALGGLTTTNKTSIVSAINEVRAYVDTAKTTINDAATDTTSVWSSSKTSGAISQAAATVKSDILGGATAAYDTLQELRVLIETGDQADQASIANLATAVGNRVRFDAAQALSPAQQLQARQNVDAASASEIGSTTTNYVTAFETALV